MSTSLVQLRVEREAERVLLTIRGEIDLSNAPELQREIHEAVDSTTDTVVDLREVEYMDSQGVRLLYRLAARLHEANARLVVIAAEDSVVGDVLRITRMADSVDVRASLD